MSLDWNITKCTKDINNETTWPITEALIWMCLMIDMPGITWENITEFQKRVFIYQTIKGAMMSANNKPYYIDKEHIVDRVGLETNVGYKNEKYFAKKCWTWLNSMATEHLKEKV